MPILHSDNHLDILQKKNIQEPNTFKNDKHMVQY